MNKIFHTHTLYFFIALSFIFSVAIRLIWVYQFHDYSDFYWNGQLMINTNDGYFYAEGARDILAGSHQANDLSPIDTPLAQVTALFAQVLPFSFETIILYMPAFLGSLLIVPILLISRLLKLETAGFIAALFGGIVWSYYNRTMTGYYDTDMLTVVLPTFILWSLLFNIQEQKNRFLPLIALFIILNAYWYPQSYSLNMAMAATLLGYTLIFDRKNLFNYKILIVMIIALAYISFIIKGLLILALFILFHFKREWVTYKSILLLLLGALALLVYAGGLAPIIVKLQGYVFRTEIMSEQGITLHFYNVAQTVREAGQIPFETFANRISGNPLIFLFALLGYIILLVRHKIMLLSLPLVGLGFMAYVGGLRFTVYAVPIMALATGYLIVQIGLFIKSKPAYYLYLTLATFLILLPNINHILGYKVPTVFPKQEVAVLDQLKDIASREDYVVSWWDYGYPIRYYADVKTLVDGGKHNGDVNFPASYAMTKPQKESAYMSRLAVEYTELAYEQNRSGSYIEMMMQDYQFSDPNDFLESMKLGLVKAPKKTRDVYYYLPLRMMDIYPTVALFSNIDLSNGNMAPAPFIYQSSNFREDDKFLHLGAGISFDKRAGTIQIQGQNIPVALFTTASYDQQNRLAINEQAIHFNGRFYAIYMPNYRRVLIMDRDAYYSTFIQLFVLEHYDHSLYEQIITTPLAKVYRLKN